MPTPEHIAIELLDLPESIAPDEGALVEFLHANLGPRLAALAAVDLTALAAEPDLDPGRAPR